MIKDHPAPSSLGYQPSTLDSPSRTSGLEVRIRALISARQTEQVQLRADRLPLQTRQYPKEVGPRAVQRLGVAVAHRRVARALVRERVQLAAPVAVSDEAGRRWWWCW